MGVSDSFLYVGRHPGEQQIVPGALSLLCSGMPGHFQNTLKWGVANTVNDPLSAQASIQHPVKINA